MRSIILVAVSLAFSGLLPRAYVHAQSESPGALGRAVFIVLPDDFRAPDGFGAGSTTPEVEAAAGLIVPWNEGADMVVMNSKHLDRESLFVTISALVNTRRGNGGGGPVVMVVQDSDGPLPGNRPHLDELLDRVRSASAGWVEGLGPARIVKFDRPGDLAVFLGQGGGH